MKFSQTFIPTLKEIPSEATLNSHILMLRAGMIRSVSSGLYAYLPYGLSLIENIKTIVREEMNAKAALEFSMPLLIPKNLLDKSKRWETFKNELFRLEDRNQTQLALSPTNEENFTQIVMNEIISYRQFPVNFYQINTKFRDEIRPRYGVMRSKEFLMKDAYSFHLSDECLDTTYFKMDDAYRRIFERCQLDFIAVKADSGNMGGSQSQEFMVKSEVGEETICYCKCGYAANIESGEEKISYEISQKMLSENSLPSEKLFTPEMKTITQVSQFLKIPIEKCIKTLVYEMQKPDGWEPFIVLIRGDYKINLTKLEKHIVLLGNKEIRLAGESVVEKIFGGKNLSGYLGVRDINKKVDILVDVSLRGIHSAVIGANQVDHHLNNFELFDEIKDYQEVNLYTVKSDGSCIKCGSPLSLIKGIEVGHIFKLGCKYTKAFGLKILNEKGESIIPTMGCYGIGISRVLAACIEQLSDEQGCILPYSIAPYKIIIVSLNLDNQRVMDTSQNLYEKLSKEGYSPLWDERDERPGSKFKDADLLGIPFQVIIGKKGLEKEKIEVRIRKHTSNEKFEVSPEEVIEFLNEKRQTFFH